MELPAHVEPAARRLVQWETRLPLFLALLLSTYQRRTIDPGKRKCPGSRNTTTVGSEGYLADENTIVTKVLIQTDTPNKNGRIFPKAVVKKAVADYQSLVGKGMAFGHISTPKGLHISLRDVSHLVTEVKVDEDGDICATIQPLDKQMGPILQDLLDRGITPKFGINGSASADNGQIVDLKISSIDVIQGTSERE